MPIVQMGHQRESLSFHRVASFPQALNLLTTRRTMRSAGVQVNFISSSKTPATRTNNILHYSLKTRKQQLLSAITYLMQLLHSHRNWPRSTLLTGDTAVVGADSAVAAALPLTLAEAAAAATAAAAAAAAPGVAIVAPVVVVAADSTVVVTAV